MVKNSRFLFLSLMSVLFLSCTMKDNLQRDIVINTDAIEFSIPIRTNLEDTLLIAELQNKVNLSEQIANNNNQFTVADLRSAYLTSFIIKLDELDTPNNDISSFISIKVELKATAKPLILLGITNNIPNRDSDSLNVNITASAQPLQDYLNADNMTYVISGVARNATTKVIQAKAVARYKLTLGM